MSNKIKWAIVGFLVMFAYGYAIFSFGPFSGVYENASGEKGLTLTSILVLSFATALIGALFSLVLFRFYKNGRKLAVYLSIVLIALVLVLSLIDGPARGDTDLAASFLTYYLPGSLMSIPLQYALPASMRTGSQIIYFSIVTFSWIAWGFLGSLVGYLLDRLKKK